MKRGFTLVELLAVIVVLAAIIAIVVPTVSNVLTDSKKSLSKVQIKNIENAAKQYYLSEGNNANTCVNLSYLIENKYLNGEEIIDPDKKETMLGSVKITFNGSQYNYEYNEEKNCEICTLLEGSGSSIGDKLECEVKPGTKYNFYILSRNDDETINLIMDRNINSDGTPTTKAIKESEKDSNGGIYNLVAWISEEDYEKVSYNSWGDWIDNNNYGPITAMNYLNNATSTWSNIGSLNITYTDEGGKYGTIQITGKARLPYYSEVNENYDLETGKNRFLYNYMDETGGIASGESAISNIYGYWSFSSYADTPGIVWRVSIFGRADIGAVDNADSFGVRPVISVSKNSIK